MSCALWTTTVESALAALPPDSCAGLLTDPPYGLDFLPQLTQGWDKRVPSLDVWRGVHRVLRPGAFGCVFGHPRLFHRVATHLEDAGFIIRDTLCWLYGTGNPKSRNDGAYGTALKPAWEPIILVQKPFEGTIADAGAYLNIAAGRVAADFADYGAPRTGGKIAAPPGIGIQCHPLGRWPANLVLDESAGAALGEPSRFFYSAKVSTLEREEGLEAFPLLSSEDLVGRQLASAGAGNARAGAGRGGGRRNPHPTMKPIALTQWLAGMLRGPVAGPLLVPFAGVGSECIGALQAGWDAVVGVEMDPRYTAMAQARMLHRNLACSRATIA